jgi:hypothetical protein
MASKRDRMPNYFVKQVAYNYCQFVEERHEHGSFSTFQLPSSCTMAMACQYPWGGRQITDPQQRFHFTLSGGESSPQREYWVLLRNPGTFGNHWSKISIVHVAKTVQANQQI